MNELTKRGGPESTIQLLDDKGELRPLEHIEREAIAFAIKHCGNITEVAEKLKIGRSTIYRKIPASGQNEKAAAE